MLWAERQQQRIFGGCGLQLEIELAAEAFSERERPRLVDAAAKRRMEDELHAAGFVEEPLEYERRLRRNDTKRRASGNEVARRLFGAPLAESRLADQPINQRRGPVGSACACTTRRLIKLPAKIRHCARKLIAARRGFSQPERNRGGRPVRITNADDAARD